MTKWNNGYYLLYSALTTFQSLYICKETAPLEGKKQKQTLLNSINLIFGLPAVYKYLTSCIQKEK